MRLMTIAVAALLVTPLTACGDDASSTSTTHAGHTEMSIGLIDYAFAGTPASVTAGTPITVTNESADEVHELAAYRLADDETRALGELRALPPEQFAALFPGAPALGLVALPGQTGQVVLGDGALHEPGRYLLLCFIPTGADPDEVVAAVEAAAQNPDAGPPVIAGGPPHFTAGMITEIEVLPA